LAGFTAIAAVGKSIERLLAQAFLDRQPVPTKPAKAVLIRTEDLDGNGIKNLVGDIGLTILLYRVDFNKTMRAAWAARAEDDGRGHLALDLHFLLTPWADNAEHQHMIIGRAMQVLERVAMLAGPQLYEPALPSPAYDDEPRAGSVDSVQVLLEEISTEALMRTFDSLPGDYHLSVPYVARVVRIDTLAEIVAPPVIDADIEMRVN
jgi:hypothetical protein